MSVQDSTPYVLVCERSRGRCGGRSFPDRLRTVLPDPSGLVVGAVSCSPLLGFSARPRLNSKPAPRPRDNLTLLSRPETGCPATARDAGILLRANSGDASSPCANPRLTPADFSLRKFNSRPQPTLLGEPTVCPILPRANSHHRPIRFRIQHSDSPTLLVASEQDRVGPRPIHPAHAGWFQPRVPTRGRSALTKLKLDDYCAIATKNNGKVHLRSSNKNDFSHEYPAVASALGA